MRGHLNFVYEALKWNAPNWITLKWTMHSQTTACITKLTERSRQFCVITQHVVVILHQHFGTTYQSHLQGSGKPKERKEYDKN